MFRKGRPQRQKGRGQQDGSESQEHGNVSSYRPWDGSGLGDKLSASLGADLEDNLKKLSGLVAAADRRVARFTCLGGQGPAAAVVFIDGMTEKVALEDRIIRPLQLGPRGGVDLFRGPRDRWLADAGERLVPVSGHKVIATFGEAVAALTAGKSVLLLHGSPGGTWLQCPPWCRRT